MSGGNVLTRWLEERFPEVTPQFFYRVLFPAGELEKRGEYVTGKYTGIVCRITSGKVWDSRKGRYKAKVIRENLLDDLRAVDDAVASEDFCICRPLSYAGKSATMDNARMLYALAVDLDKVRVSSDGRPVGLMSLWERHIEKVERVPRPTFIVSSGTGLHLYYVLDKPVPLFPDYAAEMQAYKRELTRLLWHDTVVDIHSRYEIQQEGIYQGFRMPGTVTKTGSRARAFQTGGRVSLEYLNQFVSKGSRAEKTAQAAAKKRSSLSLAEAERLYPDWFQRRIVEGQPRKAWAVNRALYEWWRDKMRTGATVGHRYYCCMMLAVYAQKCSYYDAKKNPRPVTREELEKDCLSMLEELDALTVEENNHFGEDDIQAALEAFEDRFARYPRAAIEYRTAIEIPEGKRNYNTRWEHLEEARAIRDIRARRRGEKWDIHGGRKSKASIVSIWRQENPSGTVSECVKATGVSRATVYRHWTEAETHEDS